MVSDGKQPATIKLAGVVLNDKGKIASSFKNQLNIDPPKSAALGAIFYNHHTPLAPGIYQFRVAARDEKSGRVGSAIQWIVIPDLTKSQLTLSSVLLGGQVIEDKKNQRVKRARSVERGPHFHARHKSATGFLFTTRNAMRVETRSSLCRHRCCVTVRP
jgi:hypothetical protein